MATQGTVRVLLQIVASVCLLTLFTLATYPARHADAVSQETSALQNAAISVSLSLPSSAYGSDVHVAIHTDAVSTTPQGDSNISRLVETRLHAIMDPWDRSYPRLLCPQSNLDRYAYLKRSTDQLPRPAYFFALDLHQCVDLLPRLIGSVVEAMRFLGPHNCVLSIVEGRSRDGTFELLDALRPSMRRLGISYHFASSSIDPTAEGTDRIASLAELRNLALRDLVLRPEHYDPNTTVIFSNDVALCTEDLLELIHQRTLQGADQTCAMDWTYIPASGSWDRAWDLFWNDQKAKARWASRKPFQVFACWNGVTAFTAKPFMEGAIAFRARKEGECFQGEPSLFAKDLWLRGHGKIAVVPSVNVGYSDDATARIKALKGYTSSHVARESDGAPIDWATLPPEKVKCMPNYEQQSFVPWDEGLAS
ncbi:glycosyltransferase family 69 protein [Alternaria alternata]|nr:glycosyltransferase family 69 protein [Alternaria alternata]